MFTLCTSRGPQPLQQNRQNYHKQMKCGYLLRYRRGFFCRGWSEEWMVLYEDSTIAWYEDRGLSKPKGYIRISDAPELLAVGEWTRNVPKKPRFLRSCHIEQLIVLGNSSQKVHWLMAQSPAEVNDWMTAISNTLPPPPHLLLSDKPRLSPTTHHPLAQLIKDSNCADKTNKSQDPIFDADHTVLSGVAIDWGHGWGWGRTAWTAQASACNHETQIASLYCHGEDYGAEGYNEVDWSAYGDFCF